MSLEFAEGTLLPEKPRQTYRGINRVRTTIFAIGMFLIFLSAAHAADLGGWVFKTQCAKCHGDNGDGKGHADMKVKPADLRSDAVQKKTDEELYKSIAFGVGHKEYAHAFAERGLSPEQITAVVKYIRTFAKPSKQQK